MISASPSADHEEIGVDGSVEQSSCRALGSGHVLVHDNVWIVLAPTRHGFGQNPAAGIDDSPVRRQDVRWFLGQRQQCGQFGVVARSEVVREADRPLAAFGAAHPGWTGALAS